METKESERIARRIIRRAKLLKAMGIYTEEEYREAIVIYIKNLKNGKA